MATKKRDTSDIPNPFATFGSPDNGTPVEQQASIPVSQQAGVPVYQQESRPVHQHTSKPVLKKYTYYLTDAQDMKLEQIRLARRARGVNIDKSALVREAIDHLQESDAQPVTPAPVEQPAPEVLIPLREFADLHGVNRNEAERQRSMGMIAGIKQGEGRHAIVMLGAKGRRDFWIQFHKTSGFRACDDCPHEMK